MLRRANLHTHLNGLVHVLPRGTMIRYETLHAQGIVQRIEVSRTNRLHTLAVCVDSLDAGDRAVSVAAVTRTGRAATAAAILRPDDSVECYFGGRKLAAAETPEASLRRLNEIMEAWHDSVDLGGSAVIFGNHPGMHPVNDFELFWKHVSEYKL